MDLYYYRKNKKQDKISSTDFLDNYYKKLKQTNKNVSLEKDRTGFTLKIGNRKSNHYSQIYKIKQGVKFEYEMKGRFLRKYHSSLVSNNLEEFENELSKRFVENFGKNKKLPLHYYYLDWLVIKLRPIRKQLIP